LSKSIFTDDAIFYGALQLRQRKRGYRFTEDAVLAAAFAGQGGAVTLAADWGAGCGVIGLILLHQGLTRRVVALEIQETLARLASDNASRNGLSEGYVVHRADLRQPPLRPESFPLIVSNPPHYPLGRGMISTNRERALARHELTCSVADLASSAYGLLTPEGRLVVVYPASRLARLQAVVGRAGLFPRRLRRVLPGPGRPASVVLFEASRAAGAGEVELPPLVTRDAQGQLSQEMDDLLAGRWASQD
jgi:tRNA1(Val) A37 N6-methylase TrmN6